MKVMFNLATLMSCRCHATDGTNAQPNPGFLILTSLAVAALFSNCATRPAPLTANHPASPDALEGSRARTHPSLRADALTRKSRALISAAEKEQEETSKNEPVSSAPANGKAPATPGAMPGVNHDQMKGMGQ